MASAQVTITQLPDAGPITGNEAVPIVQNGVTVQTTTGAIAASPSQTQTFLTKNQEPTLPNSRYFSTDGNFSLTDGGAQSYYRLELTGLVNDLNTIGTGVVAKDSSNNLQARTLSTSGGGINIANGDGSSGNPTFSLTGISSAIANIGVATGLLSIQNGTTATAVNILGTTNQIAVANGNGTGNPTISIADNPVLSGTEGFTVPAGTNAERPSVPNNGEIRYNTSIDRLEAYVDGSWVTIGSGDGSVTLVSGTANQITVANGTTTPQIAISSNPVLPGVGSVRVPVGNNSDRPGSPANGMIRYNTDIALFEGYVNGAWATFSSGGSGVTSIATGTGLTGGPITSTGTISIDNTGVTSGSYGAASKTLTATVNAQGQLTALAETPIAIANTQITGLGTMSTQDANNVAITGGAINGTTIGATTPAAGTFTSVAMTSGTITTAPTNGTDIVNKDYADSIASGLNYHQPVNYASTTTLPAYTYNNGTGGVGATITANANGALSLGGGSPTATQRVLIKNEVSGNAAYNGVYVVTQAGSAGTPFILTRATDYDTSGTGTNEIDQGDYVLVISGTLASTAWVQQTALPITVGTTALSFVQFNAPITYSAGTGLTLASTTFSITDTTVTAGSYGSASSVPTYSVNAQGQLTAASNTSIAIAASQITSGAVAIANGGTGQTTASAGFNALSPITTTGDLIIGNGTNSATRLPIGTNGYLLGSDGTTAAWVPAPASGVTSFSAGSTGFTPSTGTTGAVTLGGTLAVGSGGTNITNYATGDMLYATGTTTLSKLTIGTANYVLTSSGTAPQFVAQSTLSVGSATTATTATNIAGGIASQIPYQTGAGATSFIANGTAGQVLTSAGTSTPVWSGISGGTF